MSTQLTSVYDLKWEPRALIEASAGTGKTYTIVALFVRLLIEKRLDISEILVMTFTRKATSELGGRIFDRLRDCLRVLETEMSDEKDAFLAEFSEQVKDKEAAIEQIRNAILNFDESQILTIHSFCQKILKEESLTAGTLFEMELIQQDDLLQQATEDFWRLFMNRHEGSDGGRYYINKLLALADSPPDVKKLMAPLVQKPYAVVEGEGMDSPVQYLDDVLKLRKKMVQVWNDERDAILEILHNCKISRFQQYLETRLNKLESFLSDEDFSTDSPQSLQYFISDYLYDEDNLVKSGNPNPTGRHHFFELCNKYHELIDDIGSIQTTIIREAFEEISAQRNKLLKQSGTVTYDDLLITVQDALSDSERGRYLAAQLKKKYPFALVDEFQDTDPVQYQILDRIYPESGENSGLYMIGDPKQAIYGFRGADVYTYFKARDSISGTVYTLQDNYRSAPVLIEAVNTLFSGDNQPFIEDHIGFFSSSAGNTGIESEFLIDGAPGSTFKITAKRGVDRNKDEPKEFAFRQTVFEIARLLEKSESDEVTIGGEKLKAGDIAVLVSGHRDAAEIKRMLKSVGIDAVTQSRQKVFETFEAHRMELLMAAVLDPFRRTNVNNFLTSGLFGLDLTVLFEMKENVEKRDSLIEWLQDLHEVWHQDGFYPMFRAVLFHEKNLAKLAEHSDAERILTNLMQLADICSKAEKEGRLSPGELLSWFKKEKADSDQDEERTLLLESDQNLVKISTIHNSKGLQYPVVFCPGLWESKKNTAPLLEYHREESGEYVINVDQSKNDIRKAAEQKNLVESIAEDVRKAYVAMTRAKYICQLYWAGHTDSIQSGLGALLIGSEKLQEFVWNNYKISDKKEITDDFYLELLLETSENSNGSIEYEVLDNAEVQIEPVSWSENRTGLLQYNEYRGRLELPVRHRLESFSSLIHHQSDPRQPDYDQLMESFLGLFGDTGQAGSERDIFSFPRGATAGTAIHKLFEHEQFDFSTAMEADHSEIIGEILEQYRIDLKWKPTAQKMIRDVTASVIPGVDLSRVQASDQLREMEFHFPVSQQNADQLLAIIRNGKSVISSGADTKYFMTGFIDLIVRQNGTYFILDYKSNYLGDTLDDYEPKRLKLAVSEAGYDLQYHLYTVALKKYLEKRVPGFDYESDFGGAAYLFVRGMRPGSGNGVWFHKPNLKIIEQLELELMYTGQPDRY
jgi:exodeoxyribonuclease V beta subunit